MTKVDKSKVFNNLQSENILDIFSAFSVLKLVNCKLSNFSHPLKAYSIFIILFAFIFPNIILAKDLQL